MPQDAQLQPNGTYLYQGNYYTKDQLSSPESLAAISNTSTQQKKYDEALQSELESIKKRFDMYRQQQEQVTSSGAAGAQNALLQSGAGGRGSVAQYAAVTADERVKTIMADGQKALSELDSQRDQLLSAARVAYQDKNYKLLGDLNAQITKNRDQMISLAKEKNEAIATEQKRLKQSQRDNLIAGTYSAGTTEPAEILKTLNDNGGGFTLDEVTKGVDAIAKANGTNTSKMSQDVAEFYALKKEKGGLPISILGLGSTAEQIAAYLKMKSQAETKAKTSGTGSSSASVDVPEYDDPAYTVTVIRNSKGKKEMTGEQSKTITKALQAISQVDDLQKALIGQQTGPIWGTIRDKNPYDVKAQIIKGQLTALIPNLARGVYGEVGVLTDADIDNYSKTLGNLKSEKEVNDALIAITQKAAFNSIKTNLEAMAASNRDVSGFEPIYKNVQKNIEAKLPKVSPVGGSSAQDFINNPLPGTTGTVGQAYDPSIWSLFK